MKDRGTLRPQRKIIVQSFVCSSCKFFQKVTIMADTDRWSINRTDTRFMRWLKNFANLLSGQKMFP